MRYQGMPAEGGDNGEFGLFVASGDVAVAPENENESS